MNPVLVSFIASASKRSRNKETKEKMFESKLRKNLVLRLDIFANLRYGYGLPALLLVFLLCLSPPLHIRTQSSPYLFDRTFCFQITSYLRVLE